MKLLPTISVSGSELVEEDEMDWRHKGQEAGLGPEEEEEEEEAMCLSRQAEQKE